MSYNITGTTITLTRGDTFEALVSATKRDGTQYIPVSRILKERSLQRKPRHCRTMDLPSLRMWFTANK